MQLTITLVPATFIILFLQMLSCAVFIWVLARSEIVTSEGITQDKLLKFWPIVAGFVGTLICNMTALKVWPG